MSLQNDSGIAGRQQRCSEQLVLYVKAFSLLDSLSTRYGLELALASNQEPTQRLKKGTDPILSHAPVKF